ncbi:unnamed protein product [Thlaspi arvense]|uniref:BHLH domain-containing protein n=1 Tax=Thlaspi arvense TaxID=13288 RepID=A0AAU9SCT9_THLAR|nr:unnamed protein product [Thlaspi arvense]
MEGYLNERYEALKMLIPIPTKGNRASIVQDGIDYINDLRTFVSELKVLVEKKKCGGRHKNINEVGSRNPSYDISEIDHRFFKMRLYNDDETMEKKPERDETSNNSLRKSKVTEVHVRIVDDEVTIKVMQKKKFNCLLFISKVLDELHLDLHHVAGGQIGEHYSFLLNTKLSEGSTTCASAIANRVSEVVDKHCMDALPIKN